MLTSLEIENFKGIGARQRIDFAPLTLLFGANSAGKSSILQALVYLHELIERGSADVDRTELGGHVLELGGFARLVHQHDTNRAIVLRAEFATPGRLERLGRNLSDFPFPDLEDEIESAWLELTVRVVATAAFAGPSVERAVFGVNGDSEPFVSLEVGPTLRDDEPLMATINLEHPLIVTMPRDNPALWDAFVVGEFPGASQGEPPPELDELSLLLDEWSAISGPPNAPCALRVTIEGRQTERVVRSFAIARNRLSALLDVTQPVRMIAMGDEPTEGRPSTGQVRTFLEMLVQGTTSQLLGFLRESLHLGPLRAIPDLADLYERPASAASWSDGRGAWQALLVDRLDLVRRANEQLGLLGAECRVFVSSVFESSSSAGDSTSTRLHTLRLETPQGTRVLPREMGAGVSQLIPVVVAALIDRGGILAIEQPELHVHPALQTGLGDLFIAAVGGERRKRMLLLETHSEHLILRILRRIRETTEKALASDAPAFSEEKLAVLFVESTDEGVRVRRLRVDEHGEFVDRWPKGFFAERMEELL